MLEIFDFLQKGELPSEERRARKIALQVSLFTIDDEMLYYVDPKQKQQRRVVVPRHRHEQILRESHSGEMRGHFLGKRTYAALIHLWWRDGMHTDVLHFVRNCPVCATVVGGGKVICPPLHPIPAQCPFQLIGLM